MVVDLFLVFQFIRKLVTPFEKWPAYKEGVIDDKGNVLIKRKDLTKNAQRKAFGVFDQMILNIKKLLAKVPGGSSRLGTYAAALWLIKEEHRFTHDAILNESVNEDGYFEEASTEFLEWYTDYIKNVEDVNQLDELFLDEALQHVHTIKITADAPSNPKPSEVADIKNDFKLHVQAIRGAIKRLGGLITDTEVPSRQNKFVGKIKIGTRGDASKISIPVIQRGVKSGGIELDKRQFVKETELDEDGPCWDSHKQVGMKKKGNKLVPNCVPKNEDVPANNVGSGNIAGMDGDHMSKAAQKKHKKRTLKTFKALKEKE